MATMLEQLVAEITTDTKGLRKGEQDIKKFDKTLDTSTKKGTKGLGNQDKATGKLGISTAKLTAGIIGLGAAIYQGKQYIDEAVRSYGEYEAAMLSADAVAGRFGDTSAYTSGQIQAMAENMARAGLGLRTNLIEAGTELSIFQGLTKEVFDRTFAASLDLAKAKGQDLKSLIEELGEVMELPGEAVTTLEKYGIIFDDIQRKKWEAMRIDGNILEAQRQILDEIERRVGGTAQAAASGVQGLELRYQNALDAFSIAVGGMVADSELFREATRTMTEALNWLTEKIYFFSDVPNPNASPQTQLEKSAGRIKATRAEIEEMRSDIIDTIGFTAQNMYLDYDKAPHEMTPEELLKGMQKGIAELVRVIDNKDWERIHQEAARGNKNAERLIEAWKQLNIRAPQADWSLAQGLSLTKAGSRDQAIEYLRGLDDDITALLDTVEADKRILERTLGRFGSDFVPPGMKGDPPGMSLDHKPGDPVGGMSRKDVSRWKQEARDKATNEQMAREADAFKANKILADIEREAREKRLADEEAWRQKVLDALDRHESEKLARQKKWSAALQMAGAQNADAMVGITELSLKERTAQFQSYLSVWDTLLQGAAEKSRGHFQIVKAMAYANAVIKGIEAATNAYAWGSAFGGPPAGVIAAGVSLGTTGAYLAQIQSVNFQGKRDGGPVIAGHPYLMGMGHGTEALNVGNQTIVIPGENGTVTPASKMGGGTNLKITLDNKSGQKMRLENVRTKITPEGTEALADLVIDKWNNDAITGGNSVRETMDAFSQGGL